MAARDVFLQSGLPNSTLAQVWNLSDANQSGSLNCTQFVLAMHLLAAVLQGGYKLKLITIIVAVTVNVARKPKSNIKCSIDINSRYVTNFFALTFKLSLKNATYFQLIDLLSWVRKIVFFFISVLF